MRPLSHRRAALWMAFVAGAFLASTVGARADTSSDLQRAKDRLVQLRASIAEEEANLDSIQAELNAKAQAIERAYSDVERTRADISSIREQIRDSEARLEGLQQRLSERAIEAYMGGPATGLDLLLGADSITEFSDRLAFLDAIGRREAELAVAVENQRYRLDVRRAELDGLLKEQRRRLAQLEADQAALQRRFDEQQARLARVERLRAEASDLISRLEQRLEQEPAAIPPPSSGGGGGDGVPGPLFACPVDGPHAFADTFGDVHVHPGWTHIHTGNDIIAPYGTPIVAPFDGTAVGGSDESGGIYVTITGPHGFAQMLHMSSVGKLGQVRTGEVVGYIGTTGNASGPHTHFEWHPGGGAAADPYPHLSEVC